MLISWAVGVFVLISWAVGNAVQQLLTLQKSAQVLEVSLCLKSQYCAALDYLRGFNNQPTLGYSMATNLN